MLIQNAIKFIRKMSCRRFNKALIIIKLYLSILHIYLSIIHIEIKYLIYICI